VILPGGEGNLARFWKMFYIGNRILAGKGEGKAVE
jgi:hypothetical protein